MIFSSVTSGFFFFFCSTQQRDLSLWPYEKFFSPISWHLQLFEGDLLCIEISLLFHATLNSRGSSPVDMRELKSKPLAIKVQIQVPLQPPGLPPCQFTITVCLVFSYLSSKYEFSFFSCELSHVI